MKKIVTLFVLLLLISGCSGDWGWYVVNPMQANGLSNLKFLFDGFYYTILLSVCSIFISVILGLLIALPGLSKKRGIRGINPTYVELVRAAPILVFILWVYYGLPHLTVISITVFWAGVFALALSDCAFDAEILRAVVHSIV